MADPDLDADFWTVKDVAAYLQVDAATIRSYRARSQMPAADQQYGRTALWRPQTIITWQASRTRSRLGPPDST